MTSMLVTRTREEAIKIAKAVETAGADKNGKESESSKNPRPNLAQIPCIWYSITFQKKFMPMSVLFDSSI